MRYRLRTLVAILSLAAIVAAGFAYNTIVGIFVYLGCLSLFMTAWRMRIACEVVDADAEATSNPWTPHLVLLTCLGVAAAAAIAFCCMCSIAQLPFVVIAPAERLPQAEARFRLGLWLSLPIGTASAIVVYWLSWPRMSSP